MNNQIELEILNDRFDTTIDEMWSTISNSWEKLFHDHGSFHLDRQATDLRQIISIRGSYDGIGLDIDFKMDDTRLILLGATYIGESTPLGRREHLLGFIEVRSLRLFSSSPVMVQINCCWKPMYLFFKGLADSLILIYNKKPGYDAFNQMIEFKSLLERQMHSDRSQTLNQDERYFRNLLQIFLQGRSYREVPVRGGKSDLLVFTKQFRTLYETKIWRGGNYFEQGERELEQYIIGEGSDNNLVGIYYLIFDLSKSFPGRKYLGSDIVEKYIGGRTVNIILINMHLPIPSKMK